MSTPTTTRKQPARPRRRAWGLCACMVVAILTGACGPKEFFQADDQSWFESKGEASDSTLPPREEQSSAVVSADDVPALIRALASADPVARLDACRALGAMETKGRAALPALALLATDPKEPIDVRLASIEAMGAIGPWHDDVLPALSALANDADPRLSAATVRALGRMEAPAAKAAPALIKALGNPADRPAAVDALVAIGPEAVEPLTVATRAADPDVREAAQAALSRIGHPSVEPLIRSLRSPADFEGTVHTLAKIGPSALPELTKAAEDRYDPVRRGALAAMGLMGPAARPASATLIKATNDPVPAIRATAQDALGLIGPTTGPETRAIVWGLRDSDGAVRRAAGRAILRVGSDAEPEAVKELAKALSDRRWHVRAEIAAAIGRVGAAAEGAVPALVDRLEDSDPNVRVRAVRSLGLIGPGAKPALPALEKRLKDTHPDVRDAAGIAIKLVKGEGSG